MKGVLTTMILGAALAEFGLTGLQHEDGSSYQPAEQGLRSTIRSFQLAPMGRLREWS